MTVAPIGPDSLSPWGHRAHGDLAEKSPFNYPSLDVRPLASSQNFLPLSDGNLDWIVIRDRDLFVLIDCVRRCVAVDLVLVGVGEVFDLILVFVDWGYVY